MVYAQEHLLIRFHGHFGLTTTKNDTWSVGLRFGFPSAGTVYDEAKLQTFVNAAKTAGDTFQNTPAALTGTNCFLDEVTGAQIGVLGKYSPASQLTVISTSNTPKAGNSPASQPWNAALVISLRTNRPRGICSNGRVYWPCNGTIVQDNTGRLSTTQVTNRLNAAKTFLDALNTAAGAYAAGMKLLVCSFKGGGDAAVVTAIRSDDRMDSIERRENDQLSVWQNATLA